MVVSAVEEQTPDSWKEPWCLENTRTGQLHSLLSWTFPTGLPLPTVASEPWGAWMHSAKRVTTAQHHFQALGKDGILPVEQVWPWVQCLGEGEGLSP